MGLRDLHFPDLPILSMPSVQIFAYPGIMARVKLPNPTHSPRYNPPRYEKHRRFHQFHLMLLSIYEQILHCRPVRAHSTTVAKIIPIFNSPLSLNVIADHSIINHPVNKRIKNLILGITKIGRSEKIRIHLPTGYALSNPLMASPYSSIPHP